MQTTTPLWMWAIVLGPVVVVIGIWSYYDQEFCDKDARKLPAKKAFLLWLIVVVYPVLCVTIFGYLGLR